MGGAAGVSSVNGKTLKNAPPDAGQCIILGYHEIAPLAAGMRRSLVVTPRIFASHLAYLRLMRWQCVTFDDLAAAMAGNIHLPARAFVLTFDDGYIGNYLHALPIVRRFGWTATVFVPSQLIGEPQLPGTTPPVAKMDLSQLRELMRQGWSIGSHTRTHADLSQLRGADLQEEIVLARQELEETLGVAVPTFCYPYGRFNDDAVRNVAAAGHTIACTTEYGRASMDGNPLLLPRVTVGDNLSLPKFIYRIARARAVNREVAA